MNTVQIILMEIILMEAFPYSWELTLKLSSFSKPIFQPSEYEWMTKIIVPVCLKETQTLFHSFLIDSI